MRGVAHGWLLSRSEVRLVVSVSLLALAKNGPSHFGCSDVGDSYYSLCKGAEHFLIDVLCERIHDLVAARDKLVSMVRGMIFDHSSTPNGIQVWVKDEDVEKVSRTLAKLLPTVDAERAMTILAELCNSIFCETCWRVAGHAMRASSARKGFKSDTEGVYVSNLLRVVSIHSWLSNGEGRSQYDDGSWTFFDEAFKEDATGIPCDRSGLPLVRCDFDSEKKDRMRAAVACSAVERLMQDAPERALDLVMRSVVQLEGRTPLSRLGHDSLSNLECLERSSPKRKLLLLGGKILHSLGRFSEAIHFLVESIDRCIPHSETLLHLAPEDRTTDRRPPPMRIDWPLSAAVLLASQIYASSGNFARARNLAQDVMEATAGGPHVSEEEMESIRLRAREILEKLPDAEPADAVKFDEAMPAAPTTVPVHGVASWSSMGFKASAHGDILGVAPGLGWAVFKLPTGNEIIVWNFHVNKLQHRVTGIATGTTRFFELPSKLPRVKEDVPIYILLCQYDERDYSGGADCRPLMLNSLLDHPRGGTSSFADLSGIDCMRCALSSGLTLQQGMERLEARTVQLCLGPDSRSYMTYAIQGSHSTGWTLASATMYAHSFDRCKITIGRSRAQSARGPFSFDAPAALGVLHLTAGVSSLSFTTENVLASGTHDGAIKLWDCCALSCIMTLESDFVRLPWGDMSSCPDVAHMAWSPNCGTSGALLAVVNEAECQPRSLVLKCWRYREDSSRCQTLHLLHPDDGYSVHVDKMILHESHLIVVLNRCIKTFAIESSGELCPKIALPYTVSSHGEFATHGGFFFFGDASGLVAWSLRSLGGGDDDDDAAPKPWPKKAKRLNCAACGRYDPAKNQICEGCKAVHFCDRACQKAGWKTHKPFCVEIRAKKEKKRGT